MNKIDPNITKLYLEKVRPQTLNEFSLAKIASLTNAAFNPMSWGAGLAGRKLADKIKNRNQSTDQKSQDMINQFKDFQNQRSQNPGNEDAPVQNTGNEDAPVQNTGNEDAPVQEPAQKPAQEPAQATRPVVPFNRPKRQANFINPNNARSAQQNRLGRDTQQSAPQQSAPQQSAPQQSAPQQGESHPKAESPDDRLVSTTSTSAYGAQTVQGTFKRPDGTTYRKVIGTSFGG